MGIMDRFKRKPASDLDEQGGQPYEEALSKRDYATAAPLLRQAISRDDARAMGAYAAMLALGHGVEKNVEDAYCWFRQGATRGDMRSQLSLGMCLAGGTGTSVDKHEAAYWLYKAGRAGSLDAIALLGDMADRDHSIVGAHFSEDELIDLVYRFRNELKRAYMVSAAMSKETSNRTVH